MKSIRKIVKKKTKRGKENKQTKRIKYKKREKGVRAILDQNIEQPGPGDDQEYQNCTEELHSITVIKKIE